MFRIHIWIPHTIPSILSVHTWGNHEGLPPHRMQKKFRRLWRKSGPDLLNV